jgi:hypothetical protein
MWVLKILPSYCLNNSIIFATSKSAFLLLRPEISQDDFAISNMGGDILVSCIHFTFWTLVLIFIETGAFSCLANMTCRNNNVKLQYEDLMIDDTVKEEEDRVEKTSAKKMNVRVHNYRKIY